MSDPYQITDDYRWIRVRDNWDHRPCFRFTAPDGSVSWADGLSPEQGAMMERQERERAEAKNEKAA